MAEEKETVTQAEIDEKLVDWVISTIEPWEEYRESNYEADWKEFYSETMGIWTDDSRTRGSERSKFISPKMAEAVETTVADMEEATFSRKNWIDIDDNIEDPIKGDHEKIRNQLLEDMQFAKVPQAISEIYLNGAMYGTGIGKIVVSEIEEEVGIPGGDTITKTRLECSLVPVSIWEFAIDPSAKKIGEGLGCVHTPVVPKIDVIKKQENGTYYDVPLGSYTDDQDVTHFGEVKANITNDKTEIVEYHGMVPSSLLIKIEDENGEIDEIAADLASEVDESDMVEAIVTIANRTALLKAVVNPFLKRDRSFIAYQHDTIPNRFYGRGVCQKGRSPQKALNAELRARQDGLALTIHPMMAIDSTRMPRGFKPEIGPGKTLLSNGDPRTAFLPMHFGEMSAHTYREAGELERMFEVATGAMSAAMPVNINPRNQTMGGMSMIQATGIKRNKRTMRNIEEDFLKPMINKFLWRYQQFDPQRYPYNDYKLLPFSTMGMMAREAEQGQLAQVLQVMPDGPAKAMLLKGFIDNTSITRGQDFDKALEATFNPPPNPIQQQLLMLQLENARLENEKLKSEIAENYATAQSKIKQADVNAYNAIDNTQNQELDRQAFGRKETVRGN